MNIDTLILGGGLSGLSAAYHLQQKGFSSYAVIEKEPHLGGLCKSTVVNGFTFDYAGHLLHLHTEYGKNFVKSLLRDNLVTCERKAYIYTANAKIPFPFQANLHALPKTEREDCVKGLLEIAQRKENATSKSFKDWCLNHFGQGIYQQFMRPYNTKLWNCKPENMTPEWCSSFVPRPTLEEIKKSSIAPLSTQFGYNSTFYYPAQGGCMTLIQAMAIPLKNIFLDTLVTQIDLCKKVALVNNREIHFKHLINTLPLTTFVELLTQNKALKERANHLQATSIRVYNFAIHRAVKPFSWIYFPEEKIPFYRVGLQSSFSVANAPKGTSSFYVELPNSIPPTPESEKAIWNALIQKGIIEKYDQKLISFWQSIPQAYCIYDLSRTPIVNSLLSELEKQNCYCIGRYGRWEYSFMEKSILQGKEIAEKVVSEEL